MLEHNRVLVVGRKQKRIDELTRLLESAGCIVTGTLVDAVAIDLATSSNYQALVIAEEVSRSDGRYVTTTARGRKPLMPVILVHNTRSILTQLRHAGLAL